MDTIKYHRIARGLFDSPWIIEETPTGVARVYSYKGYKVWLSEVSKPFVGHATVYLYSAITPKGVLIRNRDISDIIQDIMSHV